MAFGRRFKPLFVRINEDTYGVELSPGQRELIDGLLEQLTDMLDGNNPAVRRLFPTPYGDDDERNAGYAVLAGAELIDNRQAAIAQVRASLHADAVTTEELNAWMRSVNDLRLVIGTILDVTEETVEPEGEADRELFHVYEHLGFILEHMVEALTE
ncbi:MAG: DUF2017 family protein [Microthrixaceae bacterium]|nr:DUF2017 family protein [Microthrixaceae bacterium]